jgi:hypothetical protein
MAISFKNSGYTAQNATEQRVLGRFGVQAERLGVDLPRRDRPDLTQD